MPMVLGHEAAGEVARDRTGRRRLRRGRSRGHRRSSRPAAPASRAAHGRAALCEPGRARPTPPARCWAASAAGTRRRGRAAPPPRRVRVRRPRGGRPRARPSASTDPLPFEIAALFGCAVLTGVGAAVNSAAVAAGRPRRDLRSRRRRPGRAARRARRRAPAQIVAVDVIPAKLELARELGATHAVLAGESAVEEVRTATGGGADKAIETVGSAAVLAQAYAATRRGGTTVTVGLPHPSQMLEIPAVSLVAEERTLRGSYLGSAVPARRHPALHRALRRRPAAGRSPAHAPHRPRRDQRGLRPARERRGGAPGRGLLVSGSAAPPSQRTRDRERRERCSNA